jgi:hypothetical protein
MPEEFAVTLDEGITLELREPRASFVDLSLPHGDYGRSIGVPEMVDESRVVTKVLFQESPRAIAFIRRIIAQRTTPFALYWCSQVLSIGANSVPPAAAYCHTETPSDGDRKAFDPKKANGILTITSIQQHPRLGGLRRNI